MPFFLFGKFLNIYTEGVIPARDAGSLYDGVIPVPRHWDPVELFQ
ncbi:MAG: hypothetical protein ACR5LA_08935 [Wolbachia sp.]